MRSGAIRALCAALLYLCMLPVGVAHAQSTEPGSEAFFRERVEPLLKRRCWACHGALRQRGNLRLDSRQAMLLGGTRGAALVPGDLDRSLLVQAIRRQGDLLMPPPRALEHDELATLESWITAGAPWPEGTGQSSLESALVEARAVPPVERTIEAGEPVSFNRDIRPILSNNCYACHGPDAAARQAGLRLDQADDALTELPSGRRALVPGDLVGSQLFQRIAAHQPSDRMPPASAEKPLSAEQVELIGRWIQQGAQWQKHWAFEAPSRPEAPPVQRQGWARNDIDRFVLARLENEGLEPSPAADRTTLIRRLSLDLTGLLPTSDEIDAFLADHRDGAYERLVDRLLASPRYGEHLARYWLDAARYADTNGYHIDNERFMWRWREWVIDAFNRNLPYDQFTIEQLAGDLLPEPSFEQRLATGFNRNHMINFEGGAIPEEYRTQYVFDRVDTTATVWLGLTAGCAKCHDHKFDPLTQREYYQLAAFFNSVQEQGLDGQTGNAEPLMPAPSAEQLGQQRQLEQQLAPLLARLDQPHIRADAAERSWRDDHRARIAARWHTLEPLELSSEGGASFTRLDDGSILLGGPNPDKDTIEIVADTELQGITAIRLEALTDPSLPKHGVGRSSEGGNFLLTELEIEHAPKARPFTSQALRFSHAIADHEHRFAPVTAAIDGDRATGWSADFAGRGGQRTAVFIPAEPFGHDRGTRLRIRLRHDSSYAQRVIGRFRLSLSVEPSMALAEAGPWWVNGPFESDAGSIDERAGVESTLLADGVDLERTYADGRRHWSRWRGGETGRIESIELDPGISFLYRTIDSPTERSATVRVRASAFKLWLNGELELDCGAGDAESACSGRDLDLPLLAGGNELLVKLVEIAPSPEAEKSPGPSLRFERRSEQLGQLDFELETVLAASPEQRTDEQERWLRHHFRRHHWPAVAGARAALRPASGTARRARRADPHDHGHGRAGAATRHLRAAQGGVRQEDRAGGTGNALFPATASDRHRTESTRPGSLAGAARPSADQQGHGQPGLATLLR